MEIFFSFLYRASHIEKIEFATPPFGGTLYSLVRKTYPSFFFKKNDKSLFCNTELIIYNYL